MRTYLLFLLHVNIYNSLKFEQLTNLFHMHFIFFLIYIEAAKHRANHSIEETTLQIIDVMLNYSSLV